MYKNQLLTYTLSIGISYLRKKKNQRKKDPRSPLKNTLGGFGKETVRVNNPSFNAATSDLGRVPKEQDRRHGSSSIKIPAMSPTKRSIVFVAFPLVLVSIVSFTMFFYLKKTSPKALSGTISHTGDVELSYTIPQSSGISPLCGCLAPQEADTWRGITFAARTLTLEREADLTSPPPESYRVTPRTAFYITSPLPAPINNLRTRLKFKAELYVIELSAQDVFDPDKFVTSKYPGGRVLRRNVVEQAEFIQLIGSNKVNIHLKGEKALAAWIPARNSLVSVGSMPKQFPADKKVAFIEEHYTRAPTEYADDGRPLIKDLDLPLGDFLASTVILWTEERATILTEQGTAGPPSNDSTSEKIITLAVLQPPFSIRIACQPMSDTLVDEVMARKTELLDGTPKHNEFLFLERDAGRVLLTITDPEGQTRDFDQVYDELEKNDVIYAEVTIDTSPELEKQWEKDVMDFRYPPIPRYAGFNIFGSLSRMKMDNALGILQIGTRVYPLNVPSRLELNEIEGFHVQGGTMSFPVQLDLNREAAIFHLQANCKVLVNGDPLTTRLDDYRPFSEYLMLLAAAIGALTGVASVVTGVTSLVTLRKK